MNEKYADDDLSELVQAAFDKYIVQKLDSLFEKHLPEIDKFIASRITNNYTWEVNNAISEKVKEMTENNVGNYLRVGGGRDIIDTTAFKYVNKKLEEYIESQVQFRLNRMFESIKKKFGETDVQT